MGLAVEHLFTGSKCIENSPSPLKSELHTSLKSELHPIITYSCSVSKKQQQKISDRKLRGLPGEHVEERLYDLLSERHTHLHPQPLKEGEEEAQHFICHIWRREGGGARKKSVNKKSNVLTSDCSWAGATFAI